MKLTRIHHCRNLNREKYKQLEKQAVLLGRVRGEVWTRYGAISGLNISDRTIRDGWMKEGRDFGVSANAWKETHVIVLVILKPIAKLQKKKLRRQFVKEQHAIKS